MLCNLPSLERCWCRGRRWLLNQVGQGGKRGKTGLLMRAKVMLFYSFRQGFSKPWLEAASLWAVEFLCGGAEEQGRSGSWEQRSSHHSVTLSLRASYLTFLHGLEPCQIKQMAPEQHFTQHPKPNLEKTSCSSLKRSSVASWNATHVSWVKKTWKKCQFTSQTPSCLYTCAKN